MRKRAYNWPGVYMQAGRYVVDLGLQEVPGQSEKKRIRYFYPTKAEADSKAGQLRIARKNDGLCAAVLSTYDQADMHRAQEILKAYNMSLEEAAQAYVSARAILAPYGFTLDQAARFMVHYSAAITRSVPVVDVINELIANKGQIGRSESYQADLTVRLNVFARDFAGRPIHEITGAEIEDWLGGLDCGPVNRNNYRRHLSVLFGYATNRRYALRNPVKEVAVATVRPTKPGILTVPEVRALIGAADKELLPAIVLQLFGGLRPESEVWRLKWENIDLESRLIDVEASKNTASHRYVKIEDNLAAWLAPYDHKRGAVCITDEPYFRRMKEARAAAAAYLAEQNQPALNLTDWPSDCLRHCFASYHCGHFRDSRRTSEEMGHSGDLTVFNNHYRNRTKPAEAAAYWAIMPASISAFPGSSAMRPERELVKGAGYRPGSEIEAAILANHPSSAGLP